VRVGHERRRVSVAIFEREPRDRVAALPVRGVAEARMIGIEAHELVLTARVDRGGGRNDWIWHRGGILQRTGTGSPFFHDILRPACNRSRTAGRLRIGASAAGPPTRRGFASRASC